MIILKNESATVKAGKTLGKTLKKGDTVLLSGEMGAGKTTFTKGIAKALKVKEAVLSPTFTIMCEYNGRIKLRHLDCYRLKNAFEAENAGIAEFIGNGDAVTVIEWHENIKGILPEKNVINVKLSYDGNGRVLIIE